MKNEILERITINPDVCFGKPTIRNTRYTVDLILELISSGMNKEEIVDDYPALSIEDINACLLFASQLTKLKSVHKVVA